jgi:hypothetical protein
VEARWLSPTTGLYDVRARQWAAGVGVFVQVDEYDFHDAFSTLWGWPGQAPPARMDPSGRRGPLPVPVVPPGPWLIPFVVDAVVVGAVAYGAYYWWTHRPTGGPSTMPPTPPAPGPTTAPPPGSPYRTPERPERWPGIGRCKGMNVQDLYRCCRLECKWFKDPDDAPCGPAEEENKACFDACVSQ